MDDNPENGDIPRKTAPLRRGLGRRWNAALLNLSGLSLGYFYLGRAGAGTGYFIVTLLFAWYAGAGGFARTPRGWLIVFGLWLLWMAVHAWWLSGQHWYGENRLRDVRVLRRFAAVPWAVTGLAAVLVIVLAAGLATAYAGVNRVSADTECAQHDTRADCALITEAREAAAEDNYARAVRRYEEYLALSEAPLAEEISAELAALHMDHAKVLEAEIRPSTGMGAVYDYVEVVRVYGEAAEYPETEAAQGIPAALEAMYATAVAESGAASECGPVVHLKYFAGIPPWPDIPAHPASLTRQIAPVVAEAQAQLPGALFRCGTAEHEAGRYIPAIAMLEELVNGYPDDPNVAEAQETLDAAREQQAQAEAEIAEELAEAEAAQEAEDEAEAEADRIERIKADIEQVIDGMDWDIDDDPDHIGSTGGDSVTLTLANSSPYDLEVRYTGPETEYYILDACGYCSSDCSDSASDSISLTLEPGEYDIVIEAVSDGVTPIYGVWGLDAGNEYGACYYVTE